MVTGTISDLAERARSVLTPSFRERRFSRGDLLWREGETSGWLVAIRSGLVKVYRLLPTGRAVTIFVGDDRPKPPRLGLARIRAEGEMEIQDAYYVQFLSNPKQTWQKRNLRAMQEFAPTIVDVVDA